MVVLDNNTALIVGGYNESERELATCEIYNPATATWIYTGSLNVARAYPTLVKLKNGHVLSMCGGIYAGSAEATGKVEDYDPLTGKWTIVGSLIMPRFCPTATLMNDGRILVAGGNTGPGDTPSAEIYDPTTNMSAATASMNIPRATHQTVLLNDGRVLVTGGRDGGAISDYFNECEVFDPATSTWKVTGLMNQSRTMGALTVFSDGIVLAAGGRNASTTLATGSEVFDPSTMNWASTSPIKEPVHWTQGMSMPNDKYMVTGGIIDAQLLDPSGLSVATTSKCEWYDRAQQYWYFAPELNLTRCRHNGVYIHQTTNSLLPTDFLLVAGGQQGSITQDSSGMHMFSEGFTNTAEILDVTQPALKAYMMMPANAGSAGVYAGTNDPSFRCFYQPDGSIKVEYILQNAANVTVSIVNADGQNVKELPAANVSAGSHTLNVPTSSLSSGMYFIRFVSSDGVKIFKFFVAK
jgi:hypothetical protein